MTTHAVTEVMVAAYRGRERPALELAEAMERDGEQRGLGRRIGVAECARAVLYNSLGNYPAAMRAARHGAEYQDFGVWHWTLCELVEAATRR